MNDWTSAPLEDCLERLIDYRGKSPPKSPTGIPVISAKVVKTGGLLKPIEQTIAPEHYSAWMRRGLPKVGDVILTTEGPLGEVIQLDLESVTYALGQRVVCLRGRAGFLDNTFLRYLLTSPAQQKVLSSYATGTTVEGISQKALRAVPIKFPGYDEQVRIGEVLSALDDKIELNRRMNETLEAMAQAIFRDWFVDFGPVRRRMAGATDPVEIMGGVTVDRARAAELSGFFPRQLGEQDQAWEAAPFLSVAKLISGGTPKTDQASYWNGPIAWASAKDVSQCGETFLIVTERSITELGLDESSTKIVSKYSTVVVARGATTGRFCMFGRDIAMNQTCYGLESRTGTPFWLNCAFRALVTDLVQSAHGSVFDTITTATFENAKVVRPLDALLRAFEDLVQPLFEKVLCNLEESQTLAENRDYLLPRLMSGEVRVGDAAKEIAA